MNVAMNTENEIVSLPANLKINLGFRNKCPINKLGTKPNAYFNPNVMTNDRKTDLKQFPWHVSLCLQKRFFVASFPPLARLSLAINNHYRLICRNRSCKLENDLINFSVSSVESAFDRIWAMLSIKFSYNERFWEFSAINVAVCGREGKATPTATN